MVLCAASLFFYGYWKPPYLILLVGSVVVNFIFSKHFAKNNGSKLIYLAAAFNLGGLGYFKYRNFFLENFYHIMGREVDLGGVFVPLAISFYTFQQLALLIDINDGKEECPSFMNFATFVIFYPQLIAGPIVLYKEIKKQFARISDEYHLDWELFSKGAIIFVIGLFKKSCIADRIVPFVDIAFRDAASMTILESWGGITAYAFQLYFDFSGYSDMAVGLGGMLGIKLPINFNKPYVATSMIQFWKRWHITMTRFFMMYLYSPLSLNAMRKAVTENANKHMIFLKVVAIPVFITFLLSGLWHGAGWTYIMFGIVNAVGLILNHFWKEYKLRKPGKLLGWVLTMICVLVSFVYFRAENLDQAHAFLGSMVNITNLKLPAFLAGLSPRIGIPWTEMLLFNSGTFTVKMVAWMVFAALFFYFLPNYGKDQKKIQPSFSFAMLVGLLLWIAIAWIDEPKTFIYFQF